MSTKPIPRNPSEYATLKERREQLETYYSIYSEVLRKLEKRALYTGDVASGDIPNAPPPVTTP